MWAHYAEDHKGVCLVFRGKTLNRNIQKELGNKCKIFEGKVNFTGNPNLTEMPAVSVRSLDSDAEDIARAYYFYYFHVLFFNKHLTWAYENKYRWLIHSTEKQHQFVSIQNAIKAVIVGADFPKEREMEVKGVCQGLGIPAGRMDWINGVAIPRLGEIYQP